MTDLLLCGHRQPEGGPHLNRAALAAPRGREVAAAGLLLLHLPGDLGLPRPRLHPHVQVHLVVGEASAPRAHLAPGKDVLPLFPVMCYV